jgi:hypothetical protein
MTAADPFEALGLPALPDLDDEQVRAAWRTIAAATHPDRPDGGDAARYTAAAAAYAQLRTGWGRSEAWADLTSDTAATAPLPVIHGADLAPRPRPGMPSGARRLPPGGLRQVPGGVRLLPGGVRLLPARIRHGRPLRLALRAAAAALAALLAVGALPGQPAGPAVVTGIVTWFLLSARSDLAPLPKR